MSKPALIHRIVRILEHDLEAMQAAARDGTPVADGQLEARWHPTYLTDPRVAGSAADQTAFLAECLEVFEAFDPPIYRGDAPIGPDAFVELEHNGEIVFYLLAPAAGGLTLELKGFPVIVLTAEHPLFQDLQGMRDGQISLSPHLMVLDIS